MASNVYHENQPYGDPISVGIVLFYSFEAIGCVQMEGKVYREDRPQGDPSFIGLVLL